jgi:hypothetical protein
MHGFTDTAVTAKINITVLAIFAIGAIEKIYTKDLLPKVKPAILHINPAPSLAYYKELALSDAAWDCALGPLQTT